MSHTAHAIPSYTPYGAGQLKGRARGALICGFFGGVWMFEAVFFGGIATAAWLTIATLATIAFIAWPVAQLRALRGLSNTQADRQRWSSISTLYWTDFVLEWVCCGIAVAWLVHVRRFDLIPQAVGIIIGLHFVPLAILFKAPIYYVTAAALVFGSLGSLFIPAGDVRNLAACAMNGLALWATAAVNLYRNRSRAGEERLPAAKMV